MSTVSSSFVVSTSKEQKIKARPTPDLRSFSVDSKKKRKKVPLLLLAFFTLLVSVVQQDWYHMPSNPTINIWCVLNTQ